MKRRIQILSLIIIMSRFWYSLQFDNFFLIEMYWIAHWVSWLLAIHIIKDSVECLNLNLPTQNLLRSELLKISLVFWFGLLVEFASCFAKKDLSGDDTIQLAQKALVVAIILSIVYRKKKAL